MLRLRNNLNVFLTTEVRFCKKKPANSLITCELIRRLPLASYLL